MEEEYVNSTTKMEWECRHGHTWRTTVNSIVRNWCPECSGMKRRTIEDCQAHAKTKKGKCLSKKYTNNKTKMRWECAFGHQWNARVDCVLNNGDWCAECAGSKKHTIEDCHTLAAEKDGKCLSVEYKNNKTNMQWECSLGHTWVATYDNISNANHWCHECGGTKKLTIEECKQVAQNREGLCLEDTYVNDREQMEWQCSLGHKWKATFHNVKAAKSWCPECHLNRSENFARKSLQELTGHEWEKIRPGWLMGEKGTPLELDGYCEELNAAFEYNGIQHVRYSPYFHENIGSFIDQQKRDALKDRICKERGVYLIKIPHKFNFRKEEEMEEYIMSQLEHLNF